jgi:tRNA A37 threonylcarbamoyladenosine synthetase subunit TsaC/SUA5/YrdC
MKTVLAPKRSEKTKIQKIAFDLVERLREGGVVLIASESAYVAIADPASSDGVASFRSLKDLAADISFPVFVSDVNDLLSYLPTISDRDRLLTSAFWPGLLNIEFITNEVLPSNLGADSTPASIMARKPNNPLLNVVSELMGPVIYTALKDKNGKTLKTLVGMLPAHKKLIEIAVNSGAIKSAKQTSVVSCVGSQPHMVREGSIAYSEIKKVIPSLQKL